MELAHLGFEVVSADSVQVYRYLDIGSGKPTREERERVRHHCIDIADPDYGFTAGEFCKRARLAEEEISKRGKVPLFVGGTGLYIDSYFKGLSEIPPVDDSIKNVLLRELEDSGLPTLYAELAACDAAFAAKIHPHDRQRILRGLEVFRQFGRPLSSFYESTVSRVGGPVLYIGLTVPRDELGARIGRRVDLMLDAGFIDEVRELRSRGYGPDLKSMKSIGYAEIHGFLDGAMALEDLGERIKTNTRRYAKRQMTWFSRNGRVQWFSPEETQKISGVVSRWLGSLRQ